MEQAYSQHAAQDHKSELDHILTSYKVMFEKKNARPILRFSYLHLETNFKQQTLTNVFLAKMEMSILKVLLASRIIGSYTILLYS